MNEPFTEQLHNFALGFLESSALAFLFLVGVGLLVIAYLYIVDVRQTEHAVRHSYPVIGRFRYFFEHLGQFFRQYFFAMDREELPFNRAQRAWVYRVSHAHLINDRGIPEPLDVLYPEPRPQAKLFADRQ